MARNRKNIGAMTRRRVGHKTRVDFAAAFDPNSKRLIAMHEAGHAVAAVVLGLNLRGVHIRQQVLPDGRVSVGFTDCPINLPEVVNVETMMPAMVQSLCGPLVEGLKDLGVPTDVFTAFDEDIKGFNKLAAIAVCKPVEGEDGKQWIRGENIEANLEEIREVKSRALREAMTLVETHHLTIRKVADLLLKRTSLTAAEVQQVVASSHQ